MLRPGIPQLSDEIIDAIRDGVPAYARPLEGAFGAGVRVGVEQALIQFVDLVEKPDRDRSAGREVYVRHRPRRGARGTHDGGSARRLPHRRPRRLAAGGGGCPRR